MVKNYEFYLVSDSWTSSSEPFSKNNLDILKWLLNNNNQPSGSNDFLKFVFKEKVNKPWSTRLSI